MSGLNVQQPGGDPIVDRIEAALFEAIPGADISVRGMGGHFEIRVVSEAFAGCSRLNRQRMVLGAIASLMKGDAAPVHAVDRIEAVTPDEAQPAVVGGGEGAGA